MRAAEEQDFVAFVTARLPGLRRSAYLLCGDPHRADDVVADALGTLLRKWRRISRVDRPDAYLRRMLVTAYLNEARRPWRREQSTADLPEPRPGPVPDVVDRVTLLALLDQLPPRRRAVLILRFFEDLSVEQTADALDCAVGTVKAHTHHGLADLRALLGPEVPVPAVPEKEQ